MERPYFPVFIDMEGRLVLVAGGGRIALRRVRTLLRFGAKIRVIAPRLCREFYTCSIFSFHFYFCKRRYTN